MARKKRIIAVFDASDAIDEYIGDVNALIESVTTPPGNTKVTIPPPTITQIQTDLGLLVQAQATAKSREDGTAADRDIAWDVVAADVRTIVNTVQGAADLAADEPEAIAIIQACGMRARRKGSFVKPDVAVKRDKTVFGLIHLISKGAGPGVHAAYEWQYSPDGTNWETIKIATKSRTTWNSGLAAGTKAYFRKRVTTVDLPAAPPWSQVVFVFVI